MGWIGWGPVRGFAHAVVLFALVATATTLAAPPSAQEVKEIQSLLLALRDADDHARSRAAEALANYRFREVKQALRDAARHETGQSKPNSYVLGACLALEAPAAYLWIAIGCGLALVPLQLRRERLIRAYDDVPPAAVTSQTDPRLRRKESQE